SCLYLNPPAKAMVRRRGRFRAPASKLRGVAPASKRAPARRKPPARKASPARGKRPRARSKRSGGPLSGGLPGLPVLERRQRDVLGLAVIALGVFMGSVLYGPGAPGGRAGHALAVGSGWVLGRARILAPVTLVAAGGVLLLQPVLPALR